MMQLLTETISGRAIRDLHLLSVSGVYKCDRASSKVLPKQWESSNPAPWPSHAYIVGHQLSTCVLHYRPEVKA